jgi:glycosyltransferase involved in cell wall biosynthesis
VHDGENGLLVPLGDSQALGAALRRYFEEDGLRDRLRAAASPSVAEYAPERIFAQLEEALQRVARTLAR